MNKSISPAKPKTPAKLKAAGLLLLFCLSLSSCSFVDNFGFSAGNKTRPVGAQVQAAKPIVNQKNQVTVIWQVSAETVDGYAIKYGYHPDNLEFQERVETEQLEIKLDPKLGQIYRYVLEGVAPEKKIYVAVAAVRGAELSPASAVLEVPPA